MLKRKRQLCLKNINNQRAIIWLINLKPFFKYVFINIVLWLGFKVSKESRETVQRVYEVVVEMGKVEK